MQQQHIQHSLALPRVAQACCEGAHSSVVVDVNNLGMICMSTAATGSVVLIEPESS